MKKEPPNRILEFLTAPARPDGEASRANRRRHSSAVVELSWPEGGDWRTIRGRLRDVSKGGAALVATTTPPLTRRARIRLVEGEGTPWLEAEILGADPVAPRRHRVRVRFLSPCPSFFLRLAILGVVEAEDEAPGTAYQWMMAPPEMGD